MASQSVASSTCRSAHAPHPPLEAAIAGGARRGIAVVASAGNFQQSTPTPRSIRRPTRGDRRRQHPEQQHGQPHVLQRQLGRRRRARHKHPVDLGPAAANRHQQRPPTTSDQRHLDGLAVGRRPRRSDEAVRPDLRPTKSRRSSRAPRATSASPGATRSSARATSTPGGRRRRRVLRAARAPAAPRPPRCPARAARRHLAPKVSIKGLVTLAGRSVTVRFSCAEACTGRRACGAASASCWPASRSARQAGKSEHRAPEDQEAAEGPLDGRSSRSPPSDAAGQPGDQGRAAQAAPVDAPLLAHSTRSRSRRRPGDGERVDGS